MESEALIEPDALNTDANFTDPDGFYAALTDLYRETSDEDSNRISARLILLLANHIGDMDVLSDALAIAGKIEYSAVEDEADS
jgi:hypothetical protein